MNVMVFHLSIHLNGVHHLFLILLVELAISEHRFVPNAGYQHHMSIGRGQDKNRFEDKRMLFHRSSEPIDSCYFPREFVGEKESDGQREKNHHAINPRTQSTLSETEPGLPSRNRDYQVAHYEQHMANHLDASIKDAAVSNLNQRHAKTPPGPQNSEGILRRTRPKTWPNRWVGALPFMLAFR
jgi:hypothetical protein